MAIELFANNGAGIVTAGGTTAPAAGTSESWTVNVTAAFPVASASATPPTQFHAADPAAPSETFLVTVCPGGTGFSQSWTVTRGADSTVPVVHATGFTVENVASSSTLGSWPQTYNVRAYGATGNGTTDDATATQAAVTACEGAGGGVVQAPAGTYKLGTPIAITAPISIIGDGRAATTFRLANGVNDYAFKFTQGAGAITSARFADFTIDGNAANQTAGGGISAVGAVQCYFERIHFTSCFNWGLALQPQPGGAFGHHNRVTGCLFDGAQAAGIGGGVWATSNDENFFYGDDFEYLGGTAAPSGAGSYPVYFLDQAGLQQITSCCFVGSRGNNTRVVGIRVTSTARTRIVGCTFDGVGGDNVFITGTDCVVAGNEMTSVGDQCPTAGVAAGVHLEFGALRNTVTANALDSSSTNGRTGWLIYEQQVGSSGSNVIEGNVLRVQGTVANSVLETDGIASIVRSNIGYNPVGALGPPSVPATTVALVNPYNVDASIFITGGTVTVIKIGTVTTGLTSGQFYLPAGQSITLTYSAAPSWVWIGA